MDLSMKARGRVVFIGWEEADIEMGHERRFIAKVMFDEDGGVPNWPLGVVWGQVPVTLTLDDHRTPDEERP